jgi:hypothetical protein
MLHQNGTEHLIRVQNINNVKVEGPFWKKITACWYGIQKLTWTPLRTYVIKTSHKRQLVRPDATETVLVRHPDMNRMLTKYTWQPPRMA